MYPGTYTHNSNSLPLWVRSSEKRKKLKNTPAALKLNVMLKSNQPASQPKPAGPFPHLSLPCGPHPLVIGKPLHQTPSGSGPNLGDLWLVAA